jgi:hypothetical protein
VLLNTSNERTANLAGARLLLFSTQLTSSSSALSVILPLCVRFSYKMLRVVILLLCAGSEEKVSHLGLFIVPFFFVFFGF